MPFSQEKSVLLRSIKEDSELDCAAECDFFDVVKEQRLFFLKYMLFVTTYPSTF